MISAKELRIGNWVNAKFMTDDFNFQVMEIRTSSEGYCMSQTPNISYHENTLHGIPLTNELLKRIGFEWDEITFSIHSFMLAPTGSGKRYDVFPNGLYNGCATTVDFVHELQNVYFCLLGSELPTDKI